jgi:hypothetical protein
MRTDLLKAAAIGYGVFCGINLTLAYFTSNAKTGRQPGQNALLDFNDSLTKFNLLARVLSGVTGQGAALPVPSVALPSPQQFAQGRVTITDGPGGTTTTFGQ